jgi:hypothetical protein
VTAWWEEFDKRLRRFDGTRNIAIDLRYNQVAQRDAHNSMTALYGKASAQLVTSAAVGAD